MPDLFDNSAEEIDDEQLATELRSRTLELLSKYSNLGGEELLSALIANGEFKSEEIALSSSFGADSAVLIDMVANVSPDIKIFFLETGKHFEETLQYVADLKQRLGLGSLVMLYPDENMVARTDPEGEMWQFQPNRCCWMRKVAPLEKALKDNNIKALITGRKRYQTKERGEMAVIEIDHKLRFKINPLANFSKDDISNEMKRRNLPQHPLVAKGYRSIGCAPCTTPTKAGEDERAGRWAHTKQDDGDQKQECGLHVDFDI